MLTVSRASDALRRVAVDFFTLEVRGHLEAAAVPFILLKGPSLAQWLYPGEFRAYGDCDVLVPRDHKERAGDVLTGLGLEDLSTIGGPVNEWRRSTDGFGVDLHESLIGCRVSPDEAWRVLSGATQERIVLGSKVLTLGPDALALHICLHAAQHGCQYELPMEDLSRVLGKLELNDWRRVLQLAETLRAKEFLAAGLHLDKRGKVIRKQLGLPLPSDLEAILRSEAASSPALFIESVSRTPGLIPKIGAITRRVFPSTLYMRSWSQSSGIETRGLANAYLRRLRWLFTVVPTGFREWRCARKVADARRDSEDQRA